MHNLNNLFEIYMQDCERRAVKTLQEITRIYDRYIKPSLGARELSALKRGDIAHLHLNLSKETPFQANKVLTLLRSIFNLAITLDLIESNPATHITKNREVKRKNYLTAEQFLQVTKQLDALKNNKRYAEGVDFIWMLLLTGARCGEIAKAKWSDLQGNMLILKEHKTDQYGEDRIIHISERAKTLLENRARSHDKIFSIESPRYTWNKIKKAVGCEDVRLHDLRHTYASFGLQKLPLAQVGNLLGHKDQKTTARYAHIHKDEAVESARLVGQHLEELIQSKGYQYQR